jgi:DNA-binding transcriptional LysR family regulator
MQKRKKIPRVKINLIIDNKKSVINYLNEDNIEIALVEGNVKKQKLVIEKFMSDEMVFIMPPLHPWAKRAKVSILEVAKEPIIFREEGSGTRKIIEQFFMKHGISPQDIRIISIMGNSESIKGAVEQGLGVSIVSKWAVRKELNHGRLKMATFKENKCVGDFSLLHKKTKAFSFLLDRFIDFLKKYPFDRF